MKTILHLSILLMLIAGSAGAINFVKMYRSGEINRIYERDDEQSPVAHASINSSETLFGSVIESTLLSIKVRADIELHPEMYSRGRIDEIEAKHNEPTVVAQVANKSKEDYAETKTGDGDLVTDKAIAISEKPETATQPFASVEKDIVPVNNDETTTAPVSHNKKKTAAKSDRKGGKREFSLGMYSRAALPQAYYEQIDTLIVERLDTATVKTTSPE